MNDNFKFDKGKKRLTLVPTKIIEDIADVRMFGVEKYKDPDNWKKVSAERYRDALFRHFLLYLNDPYGVDEESELKHLSHMACNIAFLCEIEKEKIEKCNACAHKPNNGICANSVCLCCKDNDKFVSKHTAL